MKIQGKHYRSVWPVGEDGFGIIDQTKLPHEFVTLTCATPKRRPMPSSPCRPAVRR